MTIIVLMSTYNGEKYLKEQLDSIVNQEILPNKVLIRDDGSSDSTIAILQEYKDKYSFIDFYCGKNKNTAKSFWELINNAGDYDYYSLCDQDDIWFRDKIKVAVETLNKENNDIPLLYCSRFTMTDENCKVLQANISKLYSYTDFPHALLYQTAPGCTFVFNKAARDKIMQYDIENNYCIIHDSIIHKIVTMFGKMILDSESHMFYRQHGNNQIGLPINTFQRIMLRISRFIKKKNKNYRKLTAEALLKIYRNEIDKSTKELLETVAYYQTNEHYKNNLLHNHCFKVDEPNYFIFKLLVLCNYI